MNALVGSLGPEEVDVRGELPRTAKGEWKARMPVRLAERSAVLASEDMLETSRGFRLEWMGPYICVIGGNIGVFSTLTLYSNSFPDREVVPFCAFRLCLLSLTHTQSLSLILPIGSNTKTRSSPFQLLRLPNNLRGLEFPKICCHHRTTALAFLSPGTLAACIHLVQSRKIVS